MKQEDQFTTSIHHSIFLIAISTITFKSGKWCQTIKLIDMKMWGFVDSCTKVIGWWSRFLMFVCMYSHIYKYRRKTRLAWLLTFCTYCSVSWNLFHQKSRECSEIFLKKRVFWKRRIVNYNVPSFSLFPRCPLLLCQYLLLNLGLLVELVEVVDNDGDGEGDA